MLPPIIDVMWRFGDSMCYTYNLVQQVSLNKAVFALIEYSHFGRLGSGHRSCGAMGSTTVGDSDPEVDVVRVSALSVGVP